MEIKAAEGIIIAECDQCCGDGGRDIDEREDCWGCGGTGLILDDDEEDCRECDGYGLIKVDEWEDCDSCGGDGEIEYVNPLMAELHQPLAELRKYGYQTQEADWCCSGCAMAAASMDKPILGYHDQDARFHTENMYLFHDFTPGRKVDEVEYARSAQFPIAVLTAGGLVVDWDYDRHKRIKVSL